MDDPARNTPAINPWPPVGAQKMQCKALELTFGQPELIAYDKCLPSTFELDSTELCQTLYRSCPSVITTFARSLGDSVTRLDRIDGDLNKAKPGDPRDTTTLGAMASDLRVLVIGNALSRRSRDQFMT